MNYQSDSNRSQRFGWKAEDIVDSMEDDPAKTWPVDSDELKKGKADSNMLPSRNPTIKGVTPVVTPSQDDIDRLTTHTEVKPEGETDPSFSRFVSQPGEMYVVEDNDEDTDEEDEEDTASTGKTLDVELTDIERLVLKQIADRVQEAHPSITDGAFAIKFNPNHDEHGHFSSGGGSGGGSTSNVISGESYPGFRKLKTSEHINEVAKNGGHVNVFPQTTLTNEDMVMHGKDAVIPNQPNSFTLTTSEDKQSLHVTANSIRDTHGNGTHDLAVGHIDKSGVFHGKNGPENEARDRRYAVRALNAHNDKVFKERDASRKQ